MAESTLFAHLALRFVSQRENLATEALAYVLRESSVARAAFADVFTRIGIELPPDLAYRTQATGNDQAIPDLVGEDADGMPRLTVEAKFWAGLTSNQPVQYLERIAGTGVGTLVFLVPSQRLELLWYELIRRCNQSGITVNDRSSAAETRIADTSRGPQLAVVTWRAALTALELATDLAGEANVVADIRQLRGLCDREDEEAFLPLTSEEMTGTLGRRVIQFSDLADDVTGRLVELGVADVKRLRAAAGKGWYGKYLRIHNVGCLLHFNAGRWANDDATPLWLSVHGPNWNKDRQISDHVRRMAQSNGIRVAESAQVIELPVFLTENVEREQVVTDAVRQMLVYAEWLRQLAVSPADDPPPEDDVEDVTESQTISP